MDRPGNGRIMKNILILCTGNSARSILAEVLFNELGQGRVRAWSAGTHPKGTVHAGAVAKLATAGHSTSGLRSKSWDEFANPGAPKLDFTFTVCDNAAGEVCPVWPGQPITAHWGLPDPAAALGNEAEKRAAFADTYRMLGNRIGVFVSLPIAKLDSDKAFDAATCIGCGACVAACPNASAALFTAAKISHLALLPQGQPERQDRVRKMVAQMDAEGFGHCTSHGECEAACPKGISIGFIAKMNRELLGAMAAAPNDVTNREK